MSSETRSSSALFKRAEQLKRWEESETNKQPSDIGNKPKKIKFSSGCVFLAACASSDKEEVLNLIKIGADINTANVDGLTALHQACIDNNMDMVEFLVENDADVNRGDNEGWTPLHATASCGFLSIAKYLIEHRASVAACNNDGELPIDIAESDEMEDLLQQHIDLQGINCEDARTFEERSMLDDAKHWLSTGVINDVPNPKTGATALHVAAAKGYIRVMNVLLQAGVNVNAEDHDGWTPLHAAAHWAQKEACEILVEHFCDMDVKNYVGQTCFDIADNDLITFLEELRKKQASMERKQPDINSIAKKNNILNKRRSSITRLSSDKNVFIKDRDVSTERQVMEQRINEEDTSPADKMPKVELFDTKSPSKTTSGVNNKMESNETSDIDIKNRLNRDDTSKISSTATNQVPKTNSTSNLSLNQTKNEEEVWWKPSSGAVRRKPDTKNLNLNINEKENTETTPTKTPSPSVPKNDTTPPDVALRRTRSFEADENRGVTSKEEPPRSNTTTTSPPSSTTTSPQNSLTNSTSVRRSFVPPVRDEESETQRKAHAKRVRETRRSTQGVTLEEIKSAEQLVKKKQQQQLVQASQQFMLEDARDTNNSNSNSISSSSDKSRVRGATDTAETTVTIPLRRPNKLVDSDKEQDKENDSRNAQATQAVIQRRKRPKRRSTGVVHVDMDEILDPDRRDKDRNHNSEHDDLTNCNDSGGGRSRANSTSSVNNDVSRTPSENGELDYKKLYEEAQIELSRVRSTLSKTEEELNQVKSSYKQNSLSEQEKRERRTMERKLSEMEVELKQLQKLKADNERLRAENRALTRVVSKLTSSNSIK